MRRFMVLLLVALAGIPAVARPGAAHTETIPAGTSLRQTLLADNEEANIGWTKKQVERRNGEPTFKSKDGSTWYYRSSTGEYFVVHFNKAGKVDRLPGAG